MPGAEPQSIWEQLSPGSLGALAEECFRALKIIDMNQSFLLSALEQGGDIDRREFSGSLTDISAASGRLERCLTNTLTRACCLQGLELPQWEPIDLSVFLSALCEEGPLIREALGVELALDCGGADSFVVLADRLYLTHICIHLLSNALRACSRRGGLVRIALRPDGRGGCLLSFTDNGCGLPGSDGYSEEESRRCFLGGTRSSLPLCREYCRLLHWTLELSPHGCGAEARLTIPLRDSAGGDVPLRSCDAEDRAREFRRLRLALRQELRALPVADPSKFKIPAKST